MEPRGRRSRANCTLSPTCRGISATVRGLAVTPHRGNMLHANRTGCTGMQGTSGKSTLMGVTWRTVSSRSSRAATCEKHSGQGAVRLKLSPPCVTCTMGA